jgi:hypothetical protein
MIAALVATLLASPCGSAFAQDRVAAPAPAGGGVERELRAIQLVGRVPMRVWSIRAFSPTEIAAMLNAAGDSANRRLTTKARHLGPLALQILPAEAGTIVNTGFPYGFNDGPLWAGRGVTVYGSAGAAAQKGPFSVRLNPFVFITQNAPFKPAIEGSFALNSPYAKTIDFPQRFGTTTYGRFDFGESEVRVQAGYVSGGLSTRGQVWGPAVEHPLILGHNAGGFPHAFIESTRPVSLWLVELHARLIWGRLDGSAFGPPDSDHRRFATAAVAAFTFPKLKGLEVGATRFFHTPWPDGGLTHAPFFNVFQGILKSTLTTKTNPSGDVPGDNQLASVFFRWAFPESKVELYGEYGREDHNANVRDFWEEIDHDAGFLLGLQRGWELANGTLQVFRLEHLNTRMGKLHPTRSQAPWYVHGVRVQGHTERGQLLGSAGGFGGGATTIALERLGKTGSTGFRWDRLMVAEQLNTNNDLLPAPGQADVIHALGINRSRNTGPGELHLGVTAALELNRNFRGDAFNLSLSTRYVFRR